MGTQTALPEKSDVVVIGGGIMGTATTYFLANQTDLDITLIEKNGIASGSTGDSSAILRHHYGPKQIYSEMAWWSHQFYRDFEEQTGEPIAYDTDPMVKFGKFDTSLGEYVQAGYEVLSDLDIPVTCQERESLEESYPMIDMTGVDFAVSDNAAGYSDGTDAAGGFARASQDAGAAVITGITVRNICVEDGTIVGIMTDNGNIETSNVVLTVGPWTPRMAECVGLDIPIKQTREQVLILDPPKEFIDSYPDLIPMGSPPDSNWYLRSDFGNRVLMATHHTGEIVDPDHYDRNPDQETILNLLDGIERFVPGLVNARISGQYCGVYSTTPDHDFIIDQAGPTGCYLGCGFSGHGFKHGPAVGRILADLVITGETDLVDIGLFSLDRFDENQASHSESEDLT